MGTETFIPRSQWDVKQLVWDNKGMETKANGF